MKLPFVDFMKSCTTSEKAKRIMDWFNREVPTRDWGTLPQRRFSFVFRHLYTKTDARHLERWAQKQALSLGTHIYLPRKVYA